MRTRKGQTKGFTLIEIMIVIAIVGILASIAVPMYDGYITKSRRVDAQIGLRNAAMVMERCRTQSFTYEDCDARVDAQSPEKYYSLLVSGDTATTFTITATPVTGKSQAGDTKCTSASINQKGEVDGLPTGTHECW